MEILQKCSYFIICFTFSYVSPCNVFFLTICTINTQGDILNVHLLWKEFSSLIASGGFEMQNLSFIHGNTPQNYSQMFHNVLGILK